MDHTKMYSKDLDSSRQELSNDGLRTVVALTVFSGIMFLVCLYWGFNLAVVKTIPENVFTPVGTNYFFAYL